MDSKPLDRTILDWIATVNTSGELYSVRSTTTRATKRSRDGRHLPSPPRSLSKKSDMSVRTPKKRKTDATIDDVTPRPFRPGPESLSSTSFQSRSDASGQSSPRKQLANLAIDPKGLIVTALNSKDDRLPPSARQLLKRINEIANNHQIIDAALEDKVENLKDAAADDESGLFLPYVFGTRDNSRILCRVSEEEQARVGSRLLDDVLAAVHEAEGCQNYEQDENSWNSLVHTPLLKAAVSLWSQELEIGFTPCTTGGLISQYKINGLTASKVDYCLFLDPCRRTPVVVANKASPDQMMNQAVVSAAIKQLQRNSLNVTVNHTDFPALRNRPIFLSIETKRYGGDQTKAEFQLGVWLASQWKMLTQQARVTAMYDVFTNLVSPSQDEIARDETVPDGKEVSGRMEGGEEQDVEKQHEGNTPLSMIPFLPGIVVDGHYWKLVITTYENGKTTLWSSRLFGSTETVLGTFKIIEGLGELIKWARVYREWYERHILGLR